MLYSQYRPEPHQSPQGLPTPLEPTTHSTFPTTLSILDQFLYYIHNIVLNLTSHPRVSKPPYNLPPSLHFQLFSAFNLNIYFIFTISPTTSPVTLGFFSPPAPGSQPTFPTALSILKQYLYYIHNIFTILRSILPVNLGSPNLGHRAYGPTVAGIRSALLVRNCRGLAGQGRSQVQ